MVQNEHLSKWLEEMKALCEPDAVHIVTGSEEENKELCQKLVDGGTFTRLKRENSFLACSNPEDVARVEGRTFICIKEEKDAGPNNNWADPDEMREKMRGFFKGCMRGRTMYVIPFCMGPLGSPWSRMAVEITDSAYVVVNMRIMTQIGDKPLEAMGNQDFVKCVHSVGVPLEQGQKDVSWPCNPEKTHIVHMPETREIWSFGSGYGGNAILNKKCFALRLASFMGRSEGWMAEHMLIIGITNPEGEKKYFAASFPSACGKTNLAMLQPTLPGWKVECVGDDIAWLHWGKDGRMYAINPEAGFFGVAPGTSDETNPHALASLAKNSIFTNVALTDEGDIWWEGMTKEPPKHLISWKGKDWTPESEEKSSHPNARFTAPLSQCPVLDKAYYELEGVPLSGIIFGGRRSDTVPVMREALNWQQGTFMGAAMSSEMTAAAKGTVGKLRHDPFAMLPFCGYNMGDYFAYWLQQEQPDRKMPAIFYVNWFLKDENGKFIWPGFGDNIRALKWMFERVDNKADAIETEIGFLPTKETFPEHYEQLFARDPDLWKKEVEGLEEYFAQFGDAMPEKLKEELATLKQSIFSKK